MSRQLLVSMGTCIFVVTFIGYIAIYTVFCQHFVVTFSPLGKNVTTKILLKYSTEDNISMDML